MRKDSSYRRCDDKRFMDSFAFRMFSTSSAICSREIWESVANANRFIVLVNGLNFSFCFRTRIFRKTLYAVWAVLRRLERGKHSADSKIRRSNRSRILSRHIGHLESSFFLRCWHTHSKHATWVCWHIIIGLTVVCRQKQHLYNAACISRGQVHKIQIIL